MLENILQVTYKNILNCLIKLCKYYNVSADFILGFSDTPIQLTDLNVDTSMETSQQKKSS